MDTIIKDNGKIVARKTRRNELHFDVQRKTRSIVVPSKKSKTMNRCVAKKELNEIRKKYY